MNVHNLELDYAVDTLASLNVTRADVIANWDAMRLSYDHDAAGDLLAGRPIRTTMSGAWSSVKQLYR